jgi:hypothetical protein
MSRAARRLGRQDAECGRCGSRDLVVERVHGPDLCPDCYNVVALSRAKRLDVEVADD